MRGLNRNHVALLVAIRDTPVDAEPPRAHPEMVKALARLGYLRVGRVLAVTDKARAYLDERKL